MAFYFTPPTIDAVSPIYVARDPFLPVSTVAQRLFRHYRPRAVGQSVLKQANGSYLTLLNPTQDQCSAATTVYLGGHRTLVTTAEATALVAAGFTVEDTSSGTPTPTAGRYTAAYGSSY